MNSKETIKCKFNEPVNVLYLTNIPAPYRVSFFNELGKYCNLTVLFERDFAHNRESSWLDKSADNYKQVFLKGVSMGNGKIICVEVLKWLRKGKFDVVVVGGYSTPTHILAMLYMRLLKKGFILSVDGGFVKNDQFSKKFFKRYLVSSASIWLSTGRETDKFLIHYGAKEERVYRYPFTSLMNEDILNDIPTIIEKKRIREKLGISESKMIISVGQFIYRKGFDVLLNAAKLIDKDIGIYIIGGNPTPDYISHKEKMKLENVHFIGFKSKEELKKYYMAADLFVLPTREDIWGLVINEAMANGLPVITTDKCIAGLELIENDENGFIVPVEDDRILASRIKQIFESESRREEMGRTSLSKIQKYTIENMVKVHLDVFDKHLKQKH